MVPTQAETPSEASGGKQDAPARYGESPIAIVRHPKPPDPSEDFVRIAEVWMKLAEGLGRTAPSETEKVG